MQIAMELQLLEWQSVTAEINNYANICIKHGTEYDLCLPA